MNDDLLSYLPEVLRDIDEFRALSCAQQPELNALWGYVKDVLDDGFAASAGENGVSRFEKLLGITPKVTYNLDERRFAVQSKLSSELPYTYKKLRQQLTMLCGADGYTAELNNELYTLTVKVELDRQSQFDEVKRIITAEAPANLIVNVILKYNKHSLLSEYKHGELEGLTYLGLRNSYSIEKSGFAASDTGTTDTLALIKPGTDDRYSINTVNRNTGVIEDALMRRYRIDMNIDASFAGKSAVLQSYGKNEITLLWDAYNGASGYVVFGWNGTYFEELRTTEECSCVLYENLPSSRIFAVRAYSEAGWLTDYAICSVTADVSDDSVRNLYARDLSNTSAELKWQAVSGAQKYRIYLKSQSGLWQQYGSDVWQAGTTLSGLTSGKTYDFAVRAVNPDKQFLTEYTAVSVMLPRYTAEKSVGGIYAYCGERYAFTAENGINTAYAAAPDTEFSLYCDGRTASGKTERAYGASTIVLSPFTSPLADVSWAAIIDAAEQGLAAEYWSVGDEKKLTLLDGTDLTLQIYGFNHDTIAGTDKKAGITFGLKYLLSHKAPLNGLLPYFYNGGFIHSDIYRYLRRFILPDIPELIRRRIKLVAKNNSVSNSSGSAYITDSQACRLFLPARSEVSESTLSFYNTEGAQYEIFTDDNSRLRSTPGGEAAPWLTRTNSVSITSDSKRAAKGMIVSSTGNVETGESDNTAYGINFCFCI